MNKISVTISIALITITLSACSEKTQTVEWYVLHPEELKEEALKCKTKTQAEIAKDKHCTVIRVAQKKEFDDRQINAPLPTFKLK